MANLNVSLPEAMKAFIEEQVRAGDYSTPSEFVRECVREYQRKRIAESEGRLVQAFLAGELAVGSDLATVRQRLVDAIDSKLLAALDSGPARDGKEVLSRLRKKNRARAK